ncbi:acyl-CoA dehydrogenase family protein [Sciscionella sediminilitoris]|uniref:acyl-CoA dehydrogenase family protein n=1 Tax=Sciscionella sediminilitoris TaxID=1445613 RepID=UPI0004DFAED5|nr:acyl-CoA dehydrogenase family protein [Sciscionella sp. SE31]
MFELDASLRALEAQAREWAVDFRAHALELDAEPDRVGEFLDLPGVRYMSSVLIPPEYGPPAARVGGYRFTGMSALERVVVMEELACGDAGLLLGSPGGAMSGVLIDLLADTEQKTRYYGRLLERPTWTFFALTEPGSGSDAAAMRAQLLPSRDGIGLRFNGAKTYIGNAARAGIGVAFARTRPGPLGVTAVLVDPDEPGFRAEPIDTEGLRALRISACEFDAVHVREEQVLGRHLSPTRRGMWSCVQTFNRLRPAVAAVALGIARAAYEYVWAHRATLRAEERERLDRIGRRVHGARQLVRYAAAAVERRGGGHLASAAKARACRLAEEVTVGACEFFGPAARFEHPLLDKFARDARGVEFMEGTRNMQLLNVFNGFMAGKLSTL